MPFSRPIEILFSSFVSFFQCISLFTSITLTLGLRYLADIYLVFHTRSMSFLTLHFPGYFPHLVGSLNAGRFSLRHRINNAAACIVEKEQPPIHLRENVYYYSTRSVLTVIGNYPSMLCTNNPFFNDDDLFPCDIGHLCPQDDIYTGCFSCHRKYV